MLLDDYESVNSTRYHYDDTKSPLTPGLIALITISTSFVFFMTIMLLVCMGEYCKYVKGKKDKSEIIRRHRKLATHTSTTNDNQPTTRTNLETSLDQSEGITSTSNSDSSSYMDRYNINAQAKSNITQGTELTDNMVEVHFEQSLDKVSVECGDGCDAVTVNLENDISIVPLITRQCEDTLDVESDIFCDSQDLRTLYKLEADV